MKNQMFITMDGGLIQDINASPDLKDVEVTVVDFDTEGQMELKKTPGGEDAVIWEEPIFLIDDKTLEFWEEVLKTREE